MIDARLQAALASGGLSLPDEGRIAVFRPPVEAALHGLPPDRCDILHDFQPFHAAWAARGYTARTEAEGRYAAAIVCLPRAKAEARALLAQAFALSDGLVVIDGQKTDGIDSMLKALRARLPVTGPISKAHGKLFWADTPGTDTLADWAAGPAQTEGGFWTAPGVFSADAVDLASALLVDGLPADLGAHVADLGAGWGFLSAHVLTRDKVKAVHLVEAGHMALECARRNVGDDRAQFHWADVTAWQPPGRIDTVVMNPPFHTERRADPKIGQAFVAAAARMLPAQGRLYMVANRHLPYETTLREHFDHVEESGGDTRFKLLHAARPIGARRKKG